MTVGSGCSVVCSQEDEQPSTRLTRMEIWEQIRAVPRHTEESVYTIEVCSANIRHEQDEVCGGTGMPATTTEYAWE